MKVALKQSAMPSDPTANQDFTDAQFSSDVKLMMPFFSRGTVTNTIAEHYALSFGATDGTTEAAICQISQDNIAVPSISRTWNSATRSAILGAVGGGATLDAEADGSLSAITNGGRLVWQSWANNELINALLIGGSDVAVKVHNLTFNGATPAVATVAHGLGDTPDIVIAFTNTLAGSNATGNFSIGFYNRVSNTYASATQRCGSGNPTQSTAVVLEDAIVSEISNSAVVWKATVTTLNSTTLTLTLSGSGSGGVTDVVKVVCLKVTGGAYKVGTFMAPLTTGTVQDITGMSLPPQMVMYIGTKLGTVNQISTANDGEALCIGAAVNNNGTTEQACISAWHDDNIATTTDTKSYTSNSKAGMHFTDTGGLWVAWNIDSWNSDGITNNYTAVATENNIIAYLAIGGVQSNSPLILPHRSSGGMMDLSGNFRG